MLENICLFVALAFIYITAMRTCRTHKSWAILSEKKSKMNKNTIKKTVAILIPVYNEVPIIKDTIAYFSELSERFDIDIYYITTSKEGVGTDNKTENIIRKLVNNKSTIVHCPKKTGAKASQLNYAFEYIKKSYDYFSIFDVDSRPDARAFEYIMHDTKSPDLYQMPSVYSRGIENASLLVKSNAIFQTRWTMCYEIPHWLFWECNIHRPLMYTVGHGLFIKSSYLKNPRHIFREDTIAEDIWYGYTASSNNATLSLIPFADYCTVPPSTLGNIKQTSRWFNGELRLAYLKDELLKIRKNKLHSVLLIIKRYLEIMLWPFGPPLIMLSTILSFFFTNYWILIMHLFGILLYAVALHYETNIKINNSSKPLIYLGISIKSLLNCLGIYQNIMSVVTKCSLEFVKTER